MNVASRENSKCKGPGVEKGLVPSRDHQRVLGPKCHVHGKVVGCEIAETGRGLVLQSLVSYDEKFGFYPQCSGEPLKSFKQRSDMIRCAFWKRSLLQPRMKPFLSDSKGVEG